MCLQKIPCYIADNLLIHLFAVVYLQFLAIIYTYIHMQMKNNSLKISNLKVFFKSLKVGHCAVTLIIILISISWSLVCPYVPIHHSLFTIHYSLFTIIFGEVTVHIICPFLFQVIYLVLRVLRIRVCYCLSLKCLLSPPGLCFELPVLWQQEARQPVGGGTVTRGGPRRL